MKIPVQFDFRNHRATESQRSAVSKHLTELKRVFGGIIAGRVVVEWVTKHLHTGGSFHCGSRGLGHQIGTGYLRDMAIAAQETGIVLPDRELACAPSSRTLVSAIWVPCVLPSIARWRTAKSSGISPAACSDISFKARLPSASTCP